MGFAVAVSGCQQNETAGGALGLGLIKKTNENQEGMVRESELRAYCPSVVLREGTAVYRSYDRKAEEDPTKLIYQASISEATRSCSYAPGTITVNVALAGKVVPGPLAKSGTVTLPIRVIAVRGSELIYSQLHNFPVTIDGSGAVQFIFSDPAVTVPSATGGEVIQVQAGYDEGPVKKTQ